MTDILLLLTERDFWYFNKESIALALVIASCTGMFWGLSHEAGKWVWFYFKNKLKK